MSIIHCTQKLLKELSGTITLLKDSYVENSGLGNWYSNIFRCNRRKCIIFTNEQSLYTFFIYGVKKKDIENIPDLFRKNLKLNLEHDEIEKRIINQIIMEHMKLDFFKTENRRVLGSMNDFVKLFKYRLEELDDITDSEILAANAEANSTPMGIGGSKYIFPIEKLKEMIKSQYSTAF